MTEKNVFTPGPRFGFNQERWELPHDLFGGQRRLVDNATRWRPSISGESPVEYQDVVRGAALNNGFMRTIRRVTSRVFVREVEIPALQEGIDEAGLLPLMDSIDNEGTPLTQWMADMHRRAAAYGLAHWIVEHTSGGEDGEGFGRPYVWPIEPMSVIDWHHDEDGRLLDLRISAEQVTRLPDKPWLSERKDTVRRYTVEEGRVISRLYVKGSEQAGSDSPVQEIPMEDARGNPIEEIPIVVLYFNRIANFEAESPYDDLAHITLRHWLSYVEQAANLKTVRIPILSMTGVETPTAGDPENAGPTGTGANVEIKRKSILQSKNYQANFDYVETTGKALEQGWRDLDKLEEQMRQFGDQPSAESSGVQTATGVWMDDLSTQGEMARWTRAGEKAATETLRLMARWRGYELPEDVAVVIREERPLQPADDRKQGRLGEMFDRNVLSKSTYLAEMQRAGALSEAVDPEREVAVASGEAAEASAMLAQLDGGDGFGSEAIDQPEDEDDGERN